MRKFASLIGSAALWCGSSIVVDAYPMILEVPEETERVSGLFVYVSFLPNAWLF